MESSQRRRNTRRCDGVGPAPRRHWSGIAKPSPDKRSESRGPEQEVNIRKALDADPQFADAYGALAAVLGSQGKFKPAEEAARRAVKLKPDSARLQQVLGFALMFQGNFASAEKELREALRLDPEDAETLRAPGRMR